MRFIIASLDHARNKARLLKDLLHAVDVDAGLTPCQATVARCLGYESWADLKIAPRTPASPLDEVAGLEVWRDRIHRQCVVIRQDFGLGERSAAGIALALRLTSRARSADTQADLARFEAKGLTAIPAETPAGSGNLSAWIMQWTEYERGWGSRPDGYSLHASATAAAEYVRAYWAGMPDAVQDEYSAPESDVVEVVVPAGHPVAVLLAKGTERFYRGPDHDAVRGLWPRTARGWQSMR